MNKKIFVLGLLFLYSFQTVRGVSGVNTIVDTTETLEFLDLKYFSFTVGFAQTAEISITFECTEGTITLYLVNEENFNRLMDLKMFECWKVEDRETGSLVQELSGGKWYIVILNTALADNTVSILATLEVVSDYSLVYIVLGLVFVGIVSVVSVFIIKRRRKSPSSAPAVHPVPPEDRYCHACGLAVPLHLNYCGNCGTRLTLALSVKEKDKALFTDE